MWNPFHKKHSHHDTWLVDYTWDNACKKDERKHPWSKKINKAVWRGLTTGAQVHDFHALPRAHLVKKSLERADIIDAGFTNFVQGHEEKKEELLSSNATKEAKNMQLVDQMNFRAIIDIDGNTWSSRFAMLLCTNSVVIKVCFWR